MNWNLPSPRLVYGIMQYQQTRGARDYDLVLRDTMQRVDRPELCITGDIFTDFRDKWIWVYRNQNPELVVCAGIPTSRLDCRVMNVHYEDFSNIVLSENRKFPDLLWLQGYPNYVTDLYNEIMSRS